MKRKLLLLVALVCCVALLSSFAHRHLTLDEVIAHEQSLRQLIAGHPFVAFVVGLLAYAAISMLPGTTGKSLVFAWLFGFWQGLVMVNFGLTAAALASFLLSRYLLREGVEERFGYGLMRLNQAIARDGALYVFALRVLHVPFTFTNYASGATSLRLRDFWWASQLGLLPGNVVFVYAGTQLPSVEELAAHGLGGVVSPQLVAAFVVLSILPLLVRYLMRWFWPKLEHDVTASGP